ncbi:ribosome biogenesis protein tsr3 [Phytophthora pseudosyringae]|uniref:Ribosome biogenesis protein tsr3 n=1 Tax=Phytophthora pseudosyringae TaxID=221518 RepID=A0A8T1WGR8_9STRA|nr:ribosome biogenesis protein tsr3 [Phytophthora pseudosyringae]
MPIVELPSDCGDPGAKFTSDHALDVNIHRFRAVAVSVVMAGAFTAVIVQFAGDGIQVGTFRSIDLDAADQKELLDKYNSISAALTALLMKPLDVFLSMVVAVAVLCVATKWSVHQESRRAYVVMAVIGAVGYLMNTGFSALNMQVSPGKIQPRITSSDLAVDDFNDSSQSTDDAVFFATFSNASYRENTPANSVLNTILRNLFVKTDKIPASCSVSQDYDVPYKELVAYYGFPSRSWQQRALSKALEPTDAITMPMNAAAAELPTDDELPMNVSIATNLAVYALITSNSFLGWWSQEDEAWGPANQCPLASRSEPLEMATCLNLSTRSSAGATFVSDVHETIVDYFSRAANASTTHEKATIAFSHFNVSDTVAFDALTIEIPTQTMAGPGGSASSDLSSYTLSDSGCNPGACLAMHDPNVLEYTADGDQTTVYPRVQALAICLNDDGGEELIVDFSFNQSSDLLQSCPKRSNTSMLIVSIGKRVEGDTFEDSSDDYSAGEMVNARTVYSLTVGRLSWLVEDLGEVYNATCTNADGCGGIRFPLERAENASSNEMALVGHSSIPMNLLSPINMNVNWFPVGSSQWKLLASTLEETRGGDMDSMPTTEPLVFPRNFKTINSTIATHMERSMSCDVMIDRHLGSIETNHLYMEHTLQPAYTTGLYFIFQNAVVLEQLPSNATAVSTKRSLAFSGNIQSMHVQASIPAASMFLAIAGCVAMVLGGVTIALLGRRGRGALHEHGTAATAAEAIANQDKFPPFMLRMKLRDAATGELVDVSLDSLRVENVVLVNESDASQQFVVGGSQFSGLLHNETSDESTPYRSKSTIMRSNGEVV